MTKYLILLFLNSFILAQSYSDIILSIYKKYPKMEVADYYKLAYQSAMGNGHSAKDSLMFVKYLDSEIKSVVPDSSQILFEYLTPDSSLARVNLAPYLYYDYSITMIINAMVQTASEFKQNKNLLLSYLKDITRLIKKKKLNIKLKDWQVFLQKMKENDYPAVHHSDTYRELYHPNYRVVLKKYLELK